MYNLHTSIVMYISIYMHMYTCTYIHTHTSMVHFITLPNSAEIVRFFRLKIFRLEGPRGDKVGRFIIRSRPRSRGDGGLHPVNWLVLLLMATRHPARKPVEVGMENLPSFTRFFTSQVEAGLLPSTVFRTVGTCAADTGFLTWYYHKTYPPTNH